MAQANPDSRQLGVLSFAGLNRLLMRKVLREQGSTAYNEAESQLCQAVWAEVERYSRQRFPRVDDDDLGEVRLVLLQRWRDGRLTGFSGWYVERALMDQCVYLLGDSAYVNAGVPRDRPANLEVIGPLPLKAALYRAPGPVEPGRRGRRPKKGERLPTPKEMLQMPEEFVADEQAFALPSGEKVLRVQTLRGVLW